MAGPEDSAKIDTAWCPGCGNFAILEAVKKALADSSRPPHEVLFVSGIGQAAKAPHYLSANVFNGLHGRSIPAATGAKIANPGLTVICESGDGCIYGEGGNHFIAAIRRNIGITVLVHDNQVYGLTKGQASPTSDEGFVSKAQPNGSLAAAFNPVAVAVAMEAGFVARGFSGLPDHLAGLILQAMGHDGFSIIDILQPCVSFNKVNTFAWYKNRCRELPSEYDPTDWEKAILTARQWGDSIPIGVIYRKDRSPMEKNIEALECGPLTGRTVNADALKIIMENYS